MPDTSKPLFGELQPHFTTPQGYGNGLLCGFSSRYGAGHGDGFSYGAATATGYGMGVGYNELENYSHQEKVWRPISIRLRKMKL